MRSRPRPSRLAQFAFDHILMALASRFDKRFRRTGIGLARLMRSALVGIIGDALVRYDLDGSSVLLPLSHELPYIRAEHPSYSQNVGQIAAAVKSKYSCLVMVDVGANIGDTVAIVANQAVVPTLCVDGDPFFYEILSQNAAAWPGVTVERALVGTSDGIARGKIESSLGTGHFVTDANQSTPMTTLSTLLARHPQFQPFKFLKIDTDGFDTAIIKAELGLLGSARPVIFFEYDPHLFRAHDEHGFEVFTSLRDAGYSTALFFTNIGDFMCRCSLENGLLLSELHSFAAMKGGHFYWDVCALSEEDVDLADLISMNVGSGHPA